MSKTKTTKQAKKAAAPKAKGTKKDAGKSKAKSKKTKTPKPVDPNKCATPRCKGEVALTHLGKPLCQKCWERQCKSENENTPATTKATVAAKPEGDAKPKAKREKKTGSDKPKRVSAIDAAAQVLQAAGRSMRSQEMIAAMTEQGLWSSPAGKTPHATLYSAILREIGTKGDASRFRKVERGLFEFNAKAAK